MPKTAVNSLFSASSELTVLTELCQIPVHRRQRQIGDLRLEHSVDPLSRGVTVGGADAGENGLALGAVSRLFHSRLRS